MKSIKIILTILTFTFISSLFFYYATAHSKANGVSSLQVLIEGLDSNGDCTLIKCGDVQILIDSAESNYAYEKIKKDMDKWMVSDSEGVWDYLIFTHPDSDHIGNATKIIDHIDNSGWKIDTIIDYGEAGKDTETAKKYKEKLKIADYEAYFTSRDLNENNPVKEFVISEDCRLLILYSEVFDGGKSNDLSVCCLIEIGDQKLLFTGDLEEGGEKSLISHHEELLDGVTFFKASHHGSQTSNTEDFIDVIRPEYVAITLEKNASGQDFSLNNFLKYTDYIYPTYVYYPDNYYKMFGNVILNLDGRNVTVETESNIGKNIRNATINFAGSTDFVWYDEQLSISEDLSDDIYVYSLDEELPGYSNCSLIKYGHYDILVDCGSTITDSTNFVKKLKKYVVDGSIEYIVVSHYHVSNISQLIGNYKNRVSLQDGVLDQFDIGKIIDGSLTNLSDSSDSGFYKKYLSKVSTKKDRKTLVPFECFEESIIPGILSIKVIGNNGLSSDENDYSLPLLITFRDEKLLFVGDTNDYSLLIDNYSNEVKDLSFLRLSNSASPDDDSYNSFADLAKPKYCVLGSPLNYTMPNGKIFAGEEAQQQILEMFKSTSISNIFFSGYINNNNEYIPVNGDLCFKIGYRGRKIYREMKSSRRQERPVCLEERY